MTIRGLKMDQTIHLIIAEAKPLAYAAIFAWAVVKIISVLPFMNR